jgi:hypothetical protein
MNTRLPGKFLQKKLSELNSALFFAEGDALIKLPNHLITEMEINEAGEILFVIPQPAKDLAAFETEFPVRLEFFKKGKLFRLNVRGWGTMISDLAEIEKRCAESKQLNHKTGNEPVLLIKVLVKHVDYAGGKSDSLPDRIKFAGMRISQWLFSGSGSKVSYAE